MKIPKCNNICEIHSEGKYQHWSCGSLESNKKLQRDYREKKKKICGVCKENKISQSSSKCRSCHFKLWKSPRIGKKLPKWWIEKIKASKKIGEESQYWVGERASYSTKHKWIVKMVGNAQNCSECGISGCINKAGKWSIEWANISQKYKRQLGDYKPLCRKCHAVFDGRTIATEDYPHGHIRRYCRGCRCDRCKLVKKLGEC